MCEGRKEKIQCIVIARVCVSGLNKHTGLLLCTVYCVGASRRVAIVLSRSFLRSDQHSDLRGCVCVCVLRMRGWVEEVDINFPGGENETAQSCSTTSTRGMFAASAARIVERESCFYDFNQDFNLKTIFFFDFSS